MWWLLLFALLLDGAKLWFRVRSLGVLAASSDPVDPSHRFFAAPGVQIDESVRRAASAHLARTGLRALDLWPADLPAPTVLGLVARFDPATWCRDRLAPTHGPGQAVVVHIDVLARMGEPSAPRSPADVQRIAERARHYSTPHTDVVVAPGLSSAPESPRDRRALFADAHGERAFGILVGHAVLIALLAVGPWASWTAGLACLAVFHLQVPVAFAASAFEVRAWAPYACLRWPWEVARWVRLVAGRWPSREALPPWPSPPLERFFHPARTACPGCGGPDLRAFVEVPDLHQGKPGRFRLRTCGTCRHVFQDPALTDEGLSYYYRDFYDGPLARGVEDVFRAMTVDYHARARAIADRTTARTWLDVGTGQGHFPCAAKDVLPDCVFDGLDQTDAVDEAARRGWIHRAFRCAFVALPDGAAWDVVSMNHYLEHTRDPRAELVAAARVLRPGGHLLIELPSSESPLGRALGWAWFPWFQPQHLHVPPVALLRRWLTEAGFETVLVDRVTPHHPVDLLLAVGLVTRRLAPDSDLPWRRGGLLSKVWRAIVAFVALPFAIVAGTLDVLMLPILRRQGWTNAFLLVARRV